MNKRIKKKKIQQEMIRHLEEIDAFKVDKDHIFVWKVDINNTDLVIVGNCVKAISRCLDKMKFKNAFVCIPDTTTLDVSDIDFLEHYMDQLKELIESLRDKETNNDK